MNGRKWEPISWFGFPTIYRGKGVGNNEKGPLGSYAPSIPQNDIWPSEGTHVMYQSNRELVMSGTINAWLHRVSSMSINDCPTSWAMISALYSPFPWGTRRRKHRTQRNSHLCINELLPPNVRHIKCWMSGLNSGNTSKVLHDQEMAGQEVDGTSIPINPTKSWTAREWRDMAIEGGSSKQTERRTRKRKLGFLHLCFAFRTPLCTTGIHFSYINVWFSSTLFSTILLIFPLWIFISHFLEICCVNQELLSKISFWCFWPPQA